MFAAAKGHSTLGIPKKVGMEFARADIKRAHGGKIPEKDKMFRQRSLANSVRHPPKSVSASGTAG
jgi:hypothetical protein